jgi:hypothetical protein
LQSGLAGADWRAGGRTIRYFLALTALAAAASAPVAAEPSRRAAPAGGVADPRAFVAQVYGAYVRGHGERTPPEPAYAYSDRLRRLFEAYNAYQAANRGELVGALDFDWWVNAQDWSLSRVAVTQIDTGPGARTVIARWNNGERADSSRFLFVRERGRWYLDDAVNGSGAGDDGWTLSALLRERP